MSNIDIANELSTWIFIGVEIIALLVVAGLIIGTLTFGITCVFGFIKGRR